ncbi:hypothetical protein MRX96_024642 [Rhipicephalus microplus]
MKHNSYLFDSIAGRTFCCPEDAREAAKFVNTSVDPCHDFYTRVCAEGLKYKLWKQMARQTELEDIITTGIVPRGVRAAEATRFLIGHYKSCIETIPYKADFVWELAHQLAMATRELLVKPDPRNALIFAATTLLKYRLPSAIEISLEPALIEISAAAICKLESLPPRVLMYSTSAVMNVTGHQVQPEEVAELAESVCRSFVSGNKKDGLARHRRRLEGDPLERGRPAVRPDHHRL